MSVYFRLFLLIPLVFAVIGATVPIVGDLGIFQFAMAVMFGGGIPYLFFVVCALVWSFRRGDASHIKAFVRSPFAFGLFCFMYGLVQSYTYGSEPFHAFVSLGVASTFAVIGFFVSAIYSWSALCIWWVVRAART